MQRYRRMDVTDEAVINELNCIEQIYKRFQAPLALNYKSYFIGKLLFSGQIFSVPQQNACPYAYGCAPASPAVNLCSIARIRQDVLATNLMLTGLFFSTFPLILGRK